MDDKGGGGGGAGPMLEYGNKALDLQKTIYEEGKTRSEPYYQAGTQGLNELMMRLGLGSGTATGNRTQEQIRSSLAPSYTNTSTAGGLKPYQTYNDNGYLDERFQQDGTTIRSITDPTGKKSYYNLGQGGNLTGDALTKFLTANQSVQSTDNAGLDAAVQRELAAQGAAGNAAQSNPLYGSLLKNFDMNSYQADPGYQFRLAEGNKALERNLNARGKTYSPEAIKALTEYNSGMASQEYGNAYNRFTNDQGNIYNRLAGIAGIGQTATQSLAQNGQNYGNAAGELYTGMGNSIVAANQAKQANRGSMFNTLIGGGLQAASLFSDERLKTNIVPVGIENGHNVYQFEYKGLPDKFIGVMAQDVLKTNPDAVIENGGFYAVNYDKIGVKFRAVEV